MADKKNGNEKGVIITFVIGVLVYVGAPVVTKVLTDKVDPDTPAGWLYSRLYPKAVSNIVLDKGTTATIVPPAAVATVPAPGATFPPNRPAPPPAAKLATDESGGVSASVQSARSDGHSIFVRMTVKTMAGARIFLVNAINDSSEVASLASGGVLQNPRLDGMAQCYNTMSGCINDQSFRDISKFDYFDAGQSRTVTMSYTLSHPIGNQETIGFALAFVARYASEAPPGSDAGPAHPVRLNLNEIPITQ